MNGKDYKEKRYGKKALIITSLVFLLLGLVLLCVGIVVTVKMHGWVKYLMMTLMYLFAFIFILFGVAMLVVSFGMTNASKSVRDGNDTVGTANVRLCNRCGRVVSEDALVCEHCGKEIGNNVKICTECKTENNGEAKFCKSCGHKFE